MLFLKIENLYAKSLLHFYEFYWSTTMSLAFGGLFLLLLTWDLPLDMCPGICDGELELNMELECTGC